MKIVVTSGKGGTGKTTVSVNLALSIGNLQLIDTDVENPNDFLFIKPQLFSERTVNVRFPEFDENICTHCGECARHCKFHAISVIPKKVLFFEHVCISCGLCAMVCPVNAITEVEKRVGVVKKGKGPNNVELVWGELDTGSTRTTTVIRETKKEYSGGFAIIDSPPGTSCPMVVAAEDADRIILVTEPTPFGLYDLKLAVETLFRMGFQPEQMGIVINRDGIASSSDVEKFARERNIGILMRIPYNPRIAELYSRGIPFVNEIPGWREKFVELFRKITGGE